jgi:hypothetical protein
MLITDDAFDLWSEVTSTPPHGCPRCGTRYRRALWPSALCWPCLRAQVDDPGTRLLAAISEAVRIRITTASIDRGLLTLPTGELPGVYVPPSPSSDAAAFARFVQDVAGPTPSGTLHRASRHEWRPRIPGQGCLACRRKTYRSAALVTGPWCSRECRTQWWQIDEHRTRGLAMRHYAMTWCELLAGITDEEAEEILAAGGPPLRSRYLYFVWQSNRTQHIAGLLRQRHQP